MTSAARNDASTPAAGSPRPPQLGDLDDATITAIARQAAALMTPVLREMLDDVLNATRDLHAQAAALDARVSAITAG
jgi:hypothetical protein